MNRFIEDEIVFVAPLPERPHSGYKSIMSRFDIPKIISNRILHHTLKKNFKKVHYYNTLNKFVDNVKFHRNHLVFPYYYGVGSRINNSHIQSVCESCSIKFVGPESYALTLCGDKVISKDICRMHNLRTPKCVGFYTEKDSIEANFLKPPVIVKPIFEGNSIGITKKSVCASIKEAKDKAKKLYSQILSPVMIEEFISGEEVNVCIMGNHTDAPVIRTVSLNKDIGVYDYKKKHYGINLNKYIPYSNPLVDDNFDVFIEIFNMLGKVEFMRIDCLISDGKMYCLELTPDADLAVASALYRSISDKDDYAKFINIIIDNSIQYYKNL